MYNIFIYLFIYIYAMCVRLFDTIWKTRIFTSLNHITTYVCYIRQMVVDKKVSKICNWMHDYATTYNCVVQTHSIRNWFYWCLFV